MYRAVAYHCIQNNLVNGDDVDTKSLFNDVQHLHIHFSRNPHTGANEVYLNNNNVEHEIRSIAVSDVVSRISKYKEIRARLVEIQHELGKNKSIVMEGRDIGTVVFPNAELKIFMTAKVEVRAQRRYQELVSKGIQTTLEAVKKNIEERDFNDIHRKESPLTKAPDALLLDNSMMNVDEQMDWVRMQLKKLGAVT
jgi:cytidylate kinase